MHAGWRPQRRFIDYLKKTARQGNKSLSSRGKGMKAIMMLQLRQVYRHAWRT